MLLFLVFLRFFRIKFVLSYISPFVAWIKNSCSDPGVFLLMMFANDLTGCFMTIESVSASSLFMMVIGVNFPLIIAWKVSNTVGSFSFLRLNLKFAGFGFLILFRRRWKVIISKSWSLPMSDLEKLCVLAKLSPDQNTSSLECNQSDCGVVHMGYARSIFWMLCED